MNDFTFNVPGDTALIIEGGGMRVSYTAGAVVTMLENDINFHTMYGISAGTSHSVDYISRDARRTKQAFVDVVSDPRFGGWGSFLRGKGFFNAHYLYEGVALENVDNPDAPMHFDWGTFAANPAEVHIQAYDVTDDRTVEWTRADMPTMVDMMVRVRASSSMPIFMPPAVIDGHVYVDGGVGGTWGIPLAAAQRDGFKRFFILRSQERGYRKSKPGAMEKVAIRAALRGMPKVAELTLDRWHHYNDICDEIERLERDGAAYVFYPERMDVSNRETNLAKLQACYERGYDQAQRELPAWKEFLGL